MTDVFVVLTDEDIPDSAWNEAGNAFDRKDHVIENGSVIRVPLDDFDLIK